MVEFEFLDPGPLIDGDLELVLTEQTPADPARNWAPAYAFRMRLPGVEEAGRINLRIGNQEALVRYGGHIGYGVNPEHRGHHYAARACCCPWRGGTAWRPSGLPATRTTGPRDAPASWSARRWWRLWTCLRTTTCTSAASAGSAGIGWTAQKAERLPSPSILSEGLHRSAGRSRRVCGGSNRRYARWNARGVKPALAADQRSAASLLASMAARAPVRINRFLKPIRACAIHLTMLDSNQRIVNGIRDGVDRDERINHCGVRGGGLAAFAAPGIA